jgi:hypothetical protein
MIFYSPLAVASIRQWSGLNAGKIVEGSQRIGCLANRKSATAEDTEKKALIEKLSKPSGVSDEERIQRAAAIIKRAADNGKTEVEVGRFPNILCTDHGRAINQQEQGWEKTLTGVPKELYEFWREHLKPRGYKLRLQIVDFPGGMPGDIGISLSWA